MNSTVIFAVFGIAFSVMGIVVLVLRDRINKQIDVVRPGAGEGSRRVVAAIVLAWGAIMSTAGIFAFVVAGASYF